MLRFKLYCFGAITWGDRVSQRGIEYKYIQVAWLFLIICTGNAAAATSCSNLVPEVYGVTPKSANALQKCLQAKNYCLMYGERVQGMLRINELPDTTPKLAAIRFEDGGHRACLFALYSGGSAAVWMFYGWDLTSGEARRLEEMSSLQLNTDVIDARSLVGYTLDNYKKLIKNPLKIANVQGYWIEFSLGSKYGGGAAHDELLNELRANPVLKGKEMFCVLWSRSDVMPTNLTPKIANNCSGSPGILIGPYANELDAKKTKELISDGMRIFAGLFKCDGYCRDIE